MAQLTQEELSERNRRLSQKVNANSIRIVRISNGYKIVRTADGEELAFPDLGFEPQDFPSGTTNVLEELQQFFYNLNKDE